MPSINELWKTDFLPFIGETFKTSLKSKKDFAAIFRMFKTKVNKSRYYDLRARGEVSVLPEKTGTGLPRLNSRRGFNTQLTSKPHVGAYEIIFESWLNDMSGEYDSAGEDIADAVYETEIEKILLAFGRITNSGYTYGDGKALAATDHPVASKGTTAGSTTYEADSDAGTFSNYYYAPLTATNVSKLENRTLRIPTPGGRMWRGNYSLALVAPELETDAAEIWGKNNKLTPTKDPDSAENAANVASGYRYMVLGGGPESLGLGFKQKQWAIVDPEEFRRCSMLYYNVKPEVKEALSTDPYVRVFTGYVNMGLGFAEPRAIMYADGDALSATAL